MRTIIIVALFIGLGKISVAQGQAREPFAIGEILEMNSKLLDEKRTVNIYLPESYNGDSIQSYPVIYLLDGSRDEDFIHIAGLVQFCSFSWINICPESIVVGIANVDRKRDFTYPSTAQIDRDEFPMAGHSEAFINFISEELQPEIEKNYRTKPEKTIIGQSLGGLLATEILLKQPELFDNYVIVSPSLWWDSELLLKETLSETTLSKKVYIAVGNEGPLMGRVARALYGKFAAANLQKADYYFEYFEAQNHGDALHLAAYNALEKLFHAKE